MLPILGILIVLGAVIGGYLMGHGNLEVLIQPAELVIIGGAAFGTLFIANPLPTIKRIFTGTFRIFGSSHFTKAHYLENLKMLNELFQAARKGGMAKLEADVEEPEKSAVFSKYPKFLKDKHSVHFVCDTLRMSITGGVGAFELDQMMELDMEVHHEETGQPVLALSQMADALPGLGIVAAVLGVVITMGSLGGPPEAIGAHVAAALVGTFLGILLCYGFFGPISANLAKLNEEEARYYQFLRMALISFVRGASPLLALEFARRAIPAKVRPSFKEMEDSFKKGG
jgi:chemotaxis protein MotA